MTNIAKNPKPKDLQLKDNEPSLLFAVRDLIATGGIDFKEWFKEWETGFIGRDQKVTNYRIENWKKPKYKDITPGNSKSGAITIEYWRDRDIQGSSVIFSGTQLDIIKHIIQFDYEGGGVNNFKTKYEEKSVKGLPLIKLYFSESKFQKSPLHSQPTTGEIYIRLIGLSDTGEGDTRKISKIDLKTFANRIKDNFLNYTWSKGQRVISYNSPEQGFKRNWYLVQTEKTGKDLITRLLKIVDQPLLVEKLRFSKAINEPKAFPSKTETVKVLEETVSLPVQRPIVDVMFLWAELKLTTRTKPILLIDKSGFVYK